MPSATGRSAIEASPRGAVQVPAKLNLFLHVTGQRSDGYHLLESLFVAIDWYDQLSISTNTSGRIERDGDIDWPVEKDLAVRAAEALRLHAQTDARLSTLAGCRIRLIKSIPHGAGLGGGSADAAYTLLLLNRLWKLHYPRETLQALGLKLGADVPFFLAEQSAYVRGIGEVITPISLASLWFVVAVPPVSVATADIFRDPLLSRSTAALGQSVVAQATKAAVWTIGRNDLEPVASRQHPIVGRLIQALGSVAAKLDLPEAACRMSGSGGAVFLSCLNQNQAEKAAELLRTALEAPNSRPSTPTGPVAGFTIRVCRSVF
jgi:4-diphosphocytidyl-2-C-methyl-D-erythritol kinase